MKGGAPSFAGSEKAYLSAEAWEDRKSVNSFWSRAHMDSDEQNAIFKQKYLARGQGDAATKDYIARKYLSSSSSQVQKKKKKSRTMIQKGNLDIFDEDVADWKNTESAADGKRKKRPREQHQMDEFNSTDSVSYNKRAPSAAAADDWQLIREEDQEDLEDEQPVIVTEDASTSRPKMTSGQKAGLLKSEELKHEAIKARIAEQRMIEKLKEGDSGRFADTVRRDETGRVIDPKIKKAKEAQARKDAMEKEERRMEWGKGLVQRSEVQKKSQQLAEEKDKPLAR